MLIQANTLIRHTREHAPTKMHFFFDELTINLPSSAGRSTNIDMLNALILHQTGIDCK